jgi:hypothetical protein
MENKNLAQLLEKLGFNYVPHRGTVDTFIKDNIKIEIPYINVIKDGKKTHMIPPYDIERIYEVTEEHESAAKNK